MSDEINQQRQCQTCSVCFVTNDNLIEHLDKYRSRERILSAKLEQCRTHSSLLDDEHDISYDSHDCDTDSTNGDVHDSTLLRRNDNPGDQLCCPHEKCDRNTRFKKRGKLKRHFAIHVVCEVVCVYCFKVFRVASQYIAHADTHKSEDPIRNTYTLQICDRLREIATTMLDEHQSQRVETKKRVRESEGTSDVRRVKGKLDVDEAISSSPLRLPSFIGIDSLPDAASLQPVLASALHPNTIGASVPTDTFDEYSAPIFSAITYPSIHVAQEFGADIGDIQTSINPSSDLGFNEYSTIPQGVQENYVFGST